MIEYKVNEPGNQRDILVRYGKRINCACLVHLNLNCHECCNLTYKIFPCYENYHQLKFWFWFSFNCIKIIMGTNKGHSLYVASVLVSICYCHSSTTINQEAFICLYVYIYIICLYIYQEAFTMFIAWLPSYVFYVTVFRKTDIQIIFSSIPEMNRLLRTNLALKFFKLLLIGRVSLLKCLGSILGLYFMNLVSK